MEKHIAQRLEEANKLIFVKRYGEAEKKLDETLRLEEGRRELIVHLRRIELAAMLKKLDKMREHYHHEIKSGRELNIHETCLALVEQHGELVTAVESINAFQEILRRYGPSPAAFYGLACGMEAQGNHERAVFNYEKALSIDPDWYVAYFGLSQIYYHTGDEKRGDHFFFIFEQAAPFNVYGNFETHRKLCQEFTQAERYQDAEAAIQALSEWWLENKGICPAEIQIYELLATARLSEVQGDHAQSEARRARAFALATQTLDDPRTDVTVLYFIAKVLEEFDDFPRAFKFYRRILKAEGNSPQIVQKIGSQFLTLGEYRLAKELFEEAYQSHPENPDIRFCLLVANLKLANVNVEEYLVGRERLRQLVDNGGDKVEMLSLLHNLVAKFAEDAEVQSQMGDVYLKLGNAERAERHYQTMQDLDGKNRATALKYAAFMMQYRDAEKAIEILSGVDVGQGLAGEQIAEVNWLKATYHARKRNHGESQLLLRKVLTFDPWNVSYLVQEIINLTHLAKIDPELKKIDKVLSELGGVEDHHLDWSEFDQFTDRIEAEKAFALAYARRKLRYLYANGSESFLKSLVAATCRHDAAQGTYDFLKLLNTNFDSAWIYWALGMIAKELWQLETAIMWFEQMLLQHDLPPELKSRAYIEMADCLVWAGRNQTRALEFAKLALELGEPKDQHVLSVLAHAHLKNGQVRMAQQFLEHAEMERVDPDTEVRYLIGLMHYRNGARGKANEVWKPLLSLRTESLRFHTIKQDVLKYYFEGTPYLKAN